MMGALRLWLSRILSLRHRWLGVVIACAIWLVWMFTGFWALLLLVLLATIGYVVGFAIERGVTWRDVVEKLLTHRDLK